MKNIMFIPLTLALLLAISTNSQALGNSGWTVVTQIVQGQGVSPAIQLRIMGEAAVGCNHASFLRMRDISTEQGKSQLSILLASVTSGKEVFIKTTDML